MSYAKKPASKAPYTLRQLGREPLVFSNLSDLRRELYLFHEPVRYGYAPEAGRSCIDPTLTYRIFDARGHRRQDLEDINHPIYHYRRVGWLGGRYTLVDAHWDEEDRARGEPVPGTGRRSGYCYFRHPRTFQELRNSIHFAEEGEPVVRGRRRSRNLPNAWDDIGRTDWKRKSWKDFRKTQWR